MLAETANTRYEIIRKIARGGMGEVFLARQIGIGGFAKDVVLKRIHESYADDPEFVTMFLQEARIAAMLDHPNIVQIYGLGQQDRSYFIVMEYVPGLSLSRLIRKAGGALPHRFAVQIAADAASGLQFAHDKRDPENNEPLNLVHRDVSPPNILVSTSGSVKITDFGIAKVKWSANKTRAGVVKGKHSYLSPEQVQGKPASRQSDLYSLGLNLYEMTTGVRAYPVEEPAKMLRNISKGKILPPETHLSDFPRDLRSVLMRALAADPGERYEQCAELQEDLLGILVGWGIAMTPAKVGQYVQDVMDGEGKAAPGPAPVVEAGALAGNGGEVQGAPESGVYPAVEEAAASLPQQDTQIVEMSTVQLDEAAAPAAEPVPVAPQEAVAAAQVAGTTDRSQTLTGPLVPPAPTIEDRRHKPTPSEPPTVDRTEVVRPTSRSGIAPRLVLLGVAVVACLALLVAILMFVIRQDPTGEAVSTNVVLATVGADGGASSGAVDPPAPPDATVAADVAVADMELPDLTEDLLSDAEAGPADAEAGPADAEAGPADADLAVDLGDLDLGEPDAATGKPKTGYRYVRRPKVALSVTTDPRTEVYYAGRKLGSTPLKSKIPKGKITLVFRNRKLGLNARRKLDPMGSRLSTHFVFRKGKLSIKPPKPCKVVVDGKPRGTTPIKPLSLFEGFHAVRLLQASNGRRLFYRRVEVKPGAVVVVP